MFFYNFALITLIFCFVDLELKNITEKYNSNFTIFKSKYFDFEIKYCINKGVMYGMHKNIKPNNLILISLCSLLFIICFYYNKINIILPLVISSLFNIYDRFINGYVRDYLYMKILGFKTNIFNLPDFFILLNMFLVLTVS